MSAGGIRVNRRSEAIVRAPINSPSTGQTASYSIGWPCPKKEVPKAAYPAANEPSTHPSDLTRRPKRDLYSLYTVASSSHRRRSMCVPEFSIALLRRGVAVDALNAAPRPFLQMSAARNQIEMIRLLAWFGVKR